ncbi:MAG: hypothetical protein OEM52_01545 [bacterium]|nr:hypothetical protein [bacterium]
MERRSIRLPNYNYQAGTFFVTICTFERRETFGEIRDAVFYPNSIGKIVEQEWLITLSMWKEMVAGAHVVMPNHFHAVFGIMRDTTGEPNRHFKSPKETVGSIVRGFKGAVTRKAAIKTNREIDQIWQRNYYEHVIRNEKEYRDTLIYIETNPLKWEFDNHNPVRSRIDG